MYKSGVDVLLTVIETSPATVPLLVALHLPAPTNNVEVSANVPVPLERLR
jgi:hypothetical protein